MALITFLSAVLRYQRGHLGKMQSVLSLRKGLPQTLTGSVRNEGTALPTQ